MKSRSGWFYGWFVVAAAFLASASLSTTLSTTLGIFLKPMAAEFELTRTSISVVRSIEQAVAGFGSPLVGGILDRYGSRLLIAGGGLLVGGALIGSAFVTEAWQLYALRIVPMSIGLILMGPLVVNVAVANWFVRRRGRALGLANMGTGFSKIFIAPVAAALVVAVGWRDGWVALGVGTIVFATIPALLWLRRRPEDMGLFPDGANQPPTAPPPGRSLVGEERTWTRRQAMRTSALWLIALAFAIVNIGNLGLNLHIVPYITDLGFSDPEAALVVSTLAVAQFACTPIWGWLTDRFDPRACAAAQFGVQVVGLLCAWWLAAPWLLYVGFFLYGFGLGGGLVIQETIWASVFGRLSLGTVRSIGQPLTLGLGAIGPVFFGGMHDLTGDYNLAFSVFMVALVIAGIMVTFIQAPKRQELPRL